jgi:hypothetical protein
MLDVARLLEEATYNNIRVASKCERGKERNDKRILTIMAVETSSSV